MGMKFNEVTTFEQEIAPRLKELGELCHKHGIPVLCACLYAATDQEMQSAQVFTDFGSFSSESIYTEKMRFAHQILSMDAKKLTFLRTALNLIGN